MAATQSSSQLLTKYNLVLNVYFLTHLLQQKSQLDKTRCFDKLSVLYLFGYIHFISATVKYKEKSKEAEQLKLQLDQAQEFKVKIMEAQAVLKRELERARQEKDKAVEAREDMSDIAETLELITLDKEMAEEKVYYSQYCPC